MDGVERARGAIAALRTQQFLPVETDNSTDTTSGLTVDEQISIAQVGYEPQDIVTGTAVARLGTFGKSSLHPFRSYEINRLSGLLGSAREHAVAEMRRQCTEIDAVGVIGVHLELQGTEEDGLATFVATGTAIRPLPGGDVGARPGGPGGTGATRYSPVRSPVRISTSCCVTGAHWSVSSSARQRSILDGGRLVAGPLPRVALPKW
jgi:uncharacterized protein YbjQ (UPF0145 family)